MKIDTLSYTKGYYNNYNNIKSYNTGNFNSPVFKSVLYNPDSFIHKSNPVLLFFDNYFKRSLNASRKAWHSPVKELKPYLKIIDTVNDKNESIRMWDINKDNRNKYIVIMHGLSHNITSLQGMYEKIVSGTDYAILAPEYHGFTPDCNDKIYLEPKKLLRDVKTSIKYLNNKGINNPNITILGHSFGGYTATKLAKEYPDLQNLILVSSINTNEHQERKLKEHRFRHVPKSVNKAINNHPLAALPLRLIFNTGKILKKVKVPVDIIHADKDKYINIQTCIQLASKCKNLRSLQIVDGYHPMDNNKINAVVSILNSY